MQDIAAEKIELTAQYSAKDRLVLVNNATVTLPENQQITLSGQFFAIGLPTISFKGSVLAQDISLALMRTQFEPHISMPEPPPAIILSSGRKVSDNHHGICRQLSDSVENAEPVQSIHEG